MKTTVQYFLLVLTMVVLTNISLLLFATHHEAQTVGDWGGHQQEDA